MAKQRLHLGLVMGALSMLLFLAGCIPLLLPTDETPSNPSDDRNTKRELTQALKTWSVWNGRSWNISMDRRITSPEGETETFHTFANASVLPQAERFWVSGRITDAAETETPLRFGSDGEDLFFLLHSREEARARWFHTRMTDIPETLPVETGHLFLQLYPMQTVRYFHQNTDDIRWTTDSMNEPIMELALNEEEFHTFRQAWIRHSGFPDSLAKQVTADLEQAALHYDEVRLRLKVSPNASYPITIHQEIKAYTNHDPNENTTIEETATFRFSGDAEWLEQDPIPLKARNEAKPLTEYQPQQ